MAKKRAKQVSKDTEEAPEEPFSLGSYLASIRRVRRMTLRQVEQATAGEVSNAYLSQLENNKIARPSPSVLHSLAKALVVPYETLMEKAGHPQPAIVEVGVLRSAPTARKQICSVLAGETLTPEEENSLLEYLAFLRSRKGGSMRKRV